MSSLPKPLPHIIMAIPSPHSTNVELVQRRLLWTKSHGWTEELKKLKWNRQNSKLCTYDTTCGDVTNHEKSCCIPCELEGFASVCDCGTHMCFFEHANA